MTPLIKKEIRLLLPAWLAVLVLEAGLPWIGSDRDITINSAPLFFFLGMVLLAVDSFGREFSLGTFSSLMVQPLERRQLWRTKLAVLLAAAALVFAAFFISCGLRLGHTPGFPGPIPANLEHDFRWAMLASGTVMLVALAGGLWTALLLRQSATAFWITLLAPMGLLAVISLAATQIIAPPSDRVIAVALYALAGLYIAGAFWLAHRLFFRAEDVGWTGGVISFSQWRYFDRVRHSTISRRQPRPLAALLQKEFQLHSVSFFGAAVLLALHLLVLFLRAFYSAYHPNTLGSLVTDYFWCLWLVLPLMIGGTAVAEERRLGVAAAQFCQPVSRGRQWTVKLLFTLFFGTLLGGVMPVVLETAALRWGAPGACFKGNGLDGLNSDPAGWFLMAIVGLAVALAWVGIFASTLTRNFLHALSLAIVICLGACFWPRYISFLLEENFTFLGLMPMPWLLLILIGAPTLVALFLWLAYRNFSHYQEGGRVWRGNLAGILGAVGFIFGSSAVIYNRSWDIFQPAEPPHGPAVFSLANRPTLESGGHGIELRVQLPDGRVWCDSLEPAFWKYTGERWKQLWRALVYPVPVSGGPGAFIAGSNWVSTTTEHVHFRTPQGTPSGAAGEVVGNLDTVGIRSDGTLWISSEAQPVVWTGARMIQVGTETNWQQVVRDGLYSVLLKTDGTLWQWGGFNYGDYHTWRTNWPSALHSPLLPIGTNADWRELFLAGRDFARKKDGGVWQLNFDGRTGRFTATRAAFLDSVVAQTYSGSAYVARDGTLQVSDQPVNDDSDEFMGTRFLPVGGESHWLAVAESRRWLVALKNDGSLWQWDMATADTLRAGVQHPPTRLGIHQDWVALAATESGVVTLAADGSLWLWPNPETVWPTLLKLPKQPEFLGNVLAAK